MNYKYINFSLEKISIRVNYALLLFVIQLGSLLVLALFFFGAKLFDN